MKFGDYLRSKRMKRNLKLIQMAEMLEISSGYLSSLESGSRTAPPFAMQQRMADLLELDTQERYRLYDLAAQSKKSPALADDLVAYINQTPQIHDMLRRSMEYQLTEKEWNDIANFAKKNYYY